MSHLAEPRSQHTGRIPLREKGQKKNRVFEVNEKLDIQVTTINSETQRKINYSFASEARTEVSDNRRHLSRAARYLRRLKSPTGPAAGPGGLAAAEHK